MVKAKSRAESQGGDIASEAQARNQYWVFQGIVEQSQSNLFKTENALRYIMGLSPGDGRLFRPSEHGA